MNLLMEEIGSPIGTVYLVTDGKAVRAIDFGGYEARMHRLLGRHYGEYHLQSAKDTTGASSRLIDYFAGDLEAVQGLAVATNGTSFQQAVWRALRSIPTGTTVSYAAIAEQIGRPKACRAVGLANGSNPIAIVVPCHRVIGANEGLTGYGGGLERKQWLLEHEGVSLKPSRPVRPRLAAGQV